MKQLPLLITLSFGLFTATAQTDSVTASHLKTVVEQIESDLDGDMELTSDTTIIDKDGTMTVHTSYYIDEGTGEVEKIMEKTLFGQLITEIVVYYWSRSPILFTTNQWQGSELKTGFDYYFQSNSPVYLVKRKLGKGSPNSDEILQWCDQLLKESQTQKLVKTNEEKKPEKKTVDPKQTAPKTKKPLFPFFKKKKN